MAIARRLLALLPLIIVVGMSLGLVTWIGYGEAHRTYPHFQHQKMAAQGEVLQNPIEGALRAGVPMRQFIGFESLADDLLDSDASLVGIVALDHDGSVLFSNLRRAQAEPLKAALARAKPEADGRYAVAADAALHVVVVPLRDRIGTVGNLVLAMPTELIRQAADVKFQPFLLAVPAITLGFLVISLLVSRGGMEQSARNLRHAYAATYSILAIAVLWSIVSLYADGIQAKSKALAASLASRVETVFELGLGLDDIEGVDRTFEAYRSLNPEISAISLEVGGKIRIHSDAAQAGNEGGQPSAWHEFQHDARVGDAGAKLAITIPLSVVAWAVAGSVKDFAVLFIASGLLAALFLQIASAGIAKRAAAGSDAADLSPLDLIRPVLFIAVFAESLAASFLPQMLRSLAGRPELASWLFMAYFVAFAAILIPAGQIADQRGPKPVLLAGILGAVTGLVALGYADGMAVAAAARALCGAGQGAILIGVQSYILAVARPDQRTRAAGIIVYGFNGGMISGAAIGALMVAYVGTTGIFLAGAAFAVCAMAYLLPLLVTPAPVAAPGKKSRGGFGQLFVDIKSALADLGFIRTMLLVGVPSKAVLTGVVGFALPLLLSALGFAQSEIGQVIMLYAGAVLLSSRYASAFVDRAGDSGRALVLGSLTGGIALCAVALGAWPPAAAALPALAAPALVMGGVVILGIAHGLINAPIVTHVADTAVAARIGQGPTTAAYRFLERIGHVAGPPLFGQLALLAGGEPIALAGLGIGIIACGLFFLVGGPSKPETEPLGSTPR